MKEIKLTQDSPFRIITVTVARVLLFLFIVTIIGPARALGQTPTAELAGIVCQLTGNHQESVHQMCNDTKGVAVFGTDLGSIFSNPDTDEVFVVFGDTFGADVTGWWNPREGLRKRHRPHVIATVQSFNHNYTDPLSSTMTFGTNWYGVNRSNDGKGLINLDISKEPTAIPTSGWSDGNNNYLWIVHIKKWANRESESTRSVLWKFNRSFGSAEQTIYQVPPKSKFALGTLIQAKTGGTEYLYLYGTRMYRAGHVYLARTAINDFYKQEPNNIYTEVYTGTNPSSPSWKKYDYSADATGSWSDPKKVVEAETPNDGGIGELSVIKHPTKNVFMMLYNDLVVKNNAYSSKIMFTTASHPWGPWSTPQEIVDCSTSFCYGSYMHPNYIKDNPDGTQSVYFITSVMYLPSSGHLWGCEKHDDQNNPNSPNGMPQCNWVYNTFLARMDIEW